MKHFDPIIALAIAYFGLLALLIICETIAKINGVSL